MYLVLEVYEGYNKPLLTDSFFISNSKSCLLVFFLVNECGAKLDMNDLNDKSKMCSYFQDAMACYPACYCNNAAMKSALDKSIKAMGVTCSLQCGSSSGTATPTSSTESASLKTCVTDGTVTPWPKTEKWAEYVSQCSCGSGICYAL